MIISEHLHKFIYSFDAIEIFVLKNSYVICKFPSKISYYVLVLYQSNQCHLIRQLQLQTCRIMSYF